MAALLFLICGAGLIAVGLLLTWRRDLLARMGYDRELMKSMRPAPLRFLEIPIQILIVLVGLGWVAGAIVMLLR